MPTGGVFSFHPFVQPAANSHLLVVTGMEWQVAANHAIQHHSQAPHIHWGTIIQPPGNNLRSSIAGRATVHLQFLPRHGVCCQAKVYELDAVAGVQ